MSRAERRVMVRRPHPGLSLSRQCRLLSIGRSWLYYTPKGESAESLALMRRIDELFLKQAGVFHGFLSTPSSRFSYTTSGRLLLLATPTVSPLDGRVF